MKKLVLILAVLVIAAPAMAASLSIADLGSGWVAINYNKDAGVMPRAFALNVSVTDGVIDGYVCSVTDGDDSIEPFNVYMGNISIDNGNIVERGSPVAPATAPDAPKPLGDASGTLVLEMGSLYVPGTSDPCEPATSGTLIKLHCSVDEFTINVTSNALRGKVVLEDTTVEDLSASLEVGMCMGDSDASGDVTTTDMNALLFHLFMNGDPGDAYRSPVGPYPMFDFDASNDLTTGDMNVLLFHLFMNGDPGDGYRSPCVP